MTWVGWDFHLPMRPLPTPLQQGGERSPHYWKVGMEVQPPHMISADVMVEGICYFLERMKVLAPQLAFSDTTLEEGLVQPRESRSLGFSACLCCHGGRQGTVRLWLLTAIEHLLSGVFCLDRLHLSWSFSWRKQVFLGAVLSVSFGISRFPVFSAANMGCLRQKENPQNPPLCHSLDSEISSQSVSESSYIWIYI